MNSNSSGTFTYPAVSTKTSGCFSHTDSGSVKTVGDYYRGISTVTMNISHTHTVIADGTVSSSFLGTNGTTSSTFPTFTGTAGTTDSNGSGTSFSILPPYVVKYCFERTA